MDKTKTKLSPNAINSYVQRMLQEPLNKDDVTKNCGLIPRYLPCPVQASNLLGMPFTIHKLVQLLEETHSNQLEISRSVRYKLFFAKVSLKTISTFQNWFINLPIPFTKIFTPELHKKQLMSEKYDSFASSWFGFIGAHQVAIPGNNENDFLFYILKKRAENDLTVSKEIPLNEKQITLYLQHSKLKLSKNYDSFQVQAALFLDFYLECMTSIDIGYREYFAPKAPIKYEEYGVITRSIIKFTNNITSNKCCFGVMLEELYCLVKIKDPNMSKRKFVQFIPINDFEESAEEKSEKQYNQYKAWVKGKEKPSNEKLLAFLIALDKAYNGNFYRVSFIYFKLAQGIDNIILTLHEEGARMEIEQTKIIAFIQSQLLNIESYYKQNLNLFKETGLAKS